MIHFPRLHVGVPVVGWPPQLFSLLASAALVGTAGFFLGLPSRPAPLSLRTEGVSGPIQESVTDAVRRRITEWRPESDPLITLEGGMQVKSSNYSGLEIEGTRYYYRPLHHVSHDPVTRGVARDYVVVARLNPGTAWEVEIYRLR